jgi:hypothetical protein
MDAVRFIADNNDVYLPEDPLAALVAHLDSCSPNDWIRHALTIKIQGWDHDTAAKWSKESAPHSKERRSYVLGKLGFSDEQAELVNNSIPIFSETEVPIVIAEAHSPWYEDRRSSMKQFYWNDYKKQLAKPKGSWDGDAIAGLDLSTDDVIARLSDPTHMEIYQAKGLVMGYVQSGKTSHFSGLIAKAADAGYRLFVVLAGMTDILRQQTQRRIDKEIVGQELLPPEEYSSSPDWPLFVQHGGRPEELGSFDWQRLTSSSSDYSALRNLLSTLEFKRHDPSKPFNDPVNIQHASAKLIVIKKVPSRINQFCSDLEKVRTLRSKLEHVPTLIIDDESDQASVNTIDPAKSRSDGRKRTSTNQAIGRLLKLMPRAQYVGYTATPFANVFIDPEDAEDIFPRDFIVSLPRPNGYMGASDFYDFDRVYSEGDFRGNKNAYVRPVVGLDEEDGNLPKAIDAFVLSGAIKLYRETKEPELFRYRHHTMLIHHSAKQKVHDDEAEKVLALFGSGRRYMTDKGQQALRKLYEEDFLPVSTLRRPSDPMPRNFGDLLKYINLCVARIIQDKPVLIVNGEKKDDTPDFDQAPVWAILVGGTKLSRGYTLEGLTVSYYRRPAGAGDTLMQMGRWFGFRPGYSDLVRLFLGSSERKGNTNIDLYGAFGAVCRDEEALRTELLKYKRSELTPLRVPPLVRQHLPTMPPTSKNKMFNAVIRSKDFSGEWKEKTSAPNVRAHKRKNRQATAKLFSQAQFEPNSNFSWRADGKSQVLRAKIGQVSTDHVVEFLKDYKWSGGRDFIALERDFLSELLSTRGVDKCTLLIPQVKSMGTFDLEDSGLKELAVVQRTRASEHRIGAYSDPQHRDIAEYISGLRTLEDPSPSLVDAQLVNRPTLVFYFFKESNEDSEISVGFAIQFHGVKTDKHITWTVTDKENADAVVVPIRRASATRGRKKATGKTPARKNRL